MSRTPRDVTDAELAILQVLWEEGPATIRRLTELLYPQGGAAAYATVQKLLERLEFKKRFVRRNRQAAAHTFEAVIGRDELIGRRLEDLADKLCGGSLTPILTHLVRTRRLSSRERQELRDLIEELDQKNRTRR
jgi:predicted transcriptional regulator